MKVLAKNKDTIAPPRRMAPVSTNSVVSVSAKDSGVDSAAAKDAAADSTAAVDSTAVADSTAAADSADVKDSADSAIDSTGAKKSATTKKDSAAAKKNSATVILATSQRPTTPENDHSDPGMIFYIHLKLLFKLLLDVLMDSPPAPEGASRSTGGILRGRAAGQGYNPVDDEDLHFSSSSIIGKVKGTILLYSSSIDPSQLDLKKMKPSMKFSVPINTHLAPVLQSAAEMFLPITSKLHFLYLDLNFNIRQFSKFDSYFRYC